MINSNKNRIQNSMCMSYWFFGCKQQKQTLANLSQKYEAGGGRRKSMMRKGKGS